MHSENVQDFNSLQHTLHWSADLNITHHQNDLCAGACIVNGVTAGVDISMFDFQSVILWQSLSTAASKL